MVRDPTGDAPDSVSPTPGQDAASTTEATGATGATGAAPADSAAAGSGRPPESSEEESLPDEVSAGTPIGRRIVLGMLGLGAAGIVFGEAAQRNLETALSPVTRNDPTGLSSFVPTAGRFRIYSVTAHMPDKSPEDYRLTVDGMVERPLTLTHDDLTSRPQTELTMDFQCVTGWRVLDVPWKGVLLADLLDEAGVAEGATHLRIHSFDGTYTESLTLEQARRGDVLVAHQMLDAPVTREQGGPVRLFVGPMYGYKSLKWLDRIEVVDALYPGYWEMQGYDVDAWVGRSNGRGDEPTSA